MEFSFSWTQSGNKHELFFTRDGIPDEETRIALFENKLNKDQTPAEQEQAHQFVWSWVHGWCHVEHHAFIEGLTLEDVKREAEEWLAKYMKAQFDSAMTYVEKNAELNNWLIKRKKGET